VTRRTVIISGFGGGYEDTCQRMLWKGVAYLSEAQPPLSIWAQVHAYEGVFGLLSTEGEGIRALEAAAMAGEDDVTGAIRQAVMGHLYAIHQHGVDGWLDHIRERDPDRVVDWEGELMPSEPDRLSEE
jgi:hypothetical protein